MIIEISSSFQLLIPYTSKYKCVQKQDKGFYIFCEEIEYEENSNAATLMCIGLEDWYHHSEDLIDSYNRTKDQLILESIESTILVRLRTLNVQSFKANDHANKKKKSSTSFVVLLILDGCAVIFQKGGQSVYNIASTGADVICSPNTLYDEERRMKNIILDEEQSKIEQTTITECFGRGPKLEIQPMRIPIANDLFIIAFSSAANILHYNESFLHEVNARREFRTEELQAWILNKYGSKSTGDFDLVLVKAKSSKFEREERRMQDEINIIGNSELFKSIRNNMTALKLVRGLVTFRNFHLSDGYLFTTKEPVMNLYIIIYGKIEINSTTTKKAAKLIATGHKNNILGEVSIFSGSENYVSDTKIIEPGRAMVISKDKLIKLIETDPRFGIKFMLEVTKEIARKEIQLLNA